MIIQQKGKFFLSVGALVVVLTVVWKASQLLHSIEQGITDSRRESAASYSDLQRELKRSTDDTRAQIDKIITEQWTVGQQTIWAYQLERLNKGSGLIVPIPEPAESKSRARVP